ncbi:MAG: hypothetical protein ACYCWA_01605 [Thiobacillus sp.]
MAARHSSRSLSITSEKHPHHHYARGTREALIHHDITREGPFPGDPGEKKTVCCTTDPHGRAILIRRSSKTTFSVWRDWSEEEKTFLEAQRARENRIKRAHAFVASWAVSVDAYREEALGNADAILLGLESMMVDGYRGGYRLNDDAASRFVGLIDEMKHLLETERFVMDQKLRDKYTPACVLKAAKAAEGSALAQYGDNVVPFPLDPYRPPLCLDSAASLSLQ